MAEAKSAVKAKYCALKLETAAFAFAHTVINRFHIGIPNLTIQELFAFETAFYMVLFLTLFKLDFLLLECDLPLIQDRVGHQDLTP